jgi:hypothetical protein
MSNIDFHDGGDDEDDFDDGGSGLTDDQVNAFLQELAHLTMKHGVEIGAWGDAEPFLVKTEAKHGYYAADDDHEGLMFITGTMIQ